MRERTRMVRPLTDPDTPPRLLGLLLECAHDGPALDFRIDFPEDVTADEIAYVRKLCDEVVEQIWLATGAGVSQVSEGWEREPDA